MCYNVRYESDEQWRLELIDSFKCIKNLGPFKAVHDVKLAKNTLIFAENGRGKTMLSEALRSLATGQPDLVAGRARLGADGGDPVVVFCQSGEGKDLVWTREGWSDGKPQMAVFNDGFVDANVYSGLDVTSEHRKGLHSLVIGEPGVRLANDFKAAQTSATKALDDVKEVVGKLKEAVPGLKDEGVRKFCEGQTPEDIDDRIQNNARSLAIAQNATKIASRPALSEIEPPVLKIEELTVLLSKGIPQVAGDAMDRVKNHFNGVWEGAESWVNQGWSHARDYVDCPYCGQPLTNSSLVEHFATYFEGAYGEHKKEVAKFRDEFDSHNSEPRRRRFEDQARQWLTLRQEWADDILGLSTDVKFDLPQMVEDWQTFAAAAKSALDQKEASPLERIQIEEGVLNRIEGHLRSIKSENERRPDINEKIRSFKESVAAADVEALKNEALDLERQMKRNTPAVNELCEEYRDKAKTREREKAHSDRLNSDLTAHRERVFEEYRDSVNRYLDGFGAGFSLPRIRGTSRAGGTSEFEFEINGHPVAITGERPATGGAWFNNTLSGGDRKALAFAFFLASLESREDIDQTIVVIDDPLSSLDYARWQATATEIQRLERKVGQLLVFSHDLSFLCRVERLLNEESRCHLQIQSEDDSSIVAKWDISEACLSEYESRAIRLRRYCDGRNYNRTEIKADIRIHVETYLLISLPGHFTRRRSMSTFLSMCRKAVKRGEEILSEERINELAELVNFTDPELHPHPHHSKSDTELRAWGRRALRFCGEHGR